VVATLKNGLAANDRGAAMRIALAYAIVSISDA
jgi:hypothetical protein